jgi:hypothetical protein
VTFKKTHYPISAIHAHAALSLGREGKQDPSCDRPPHSQSSSKILPENSFARAFNANGRSVKMIEQGQACC